LRLLGMRLTVGSTTDDCQRMMLVTPSRQRLDAAEQRYSSKYPLTVAARSRARHTHKEKHAEKMIERIRSVSLSGRIPSNKIEIQKNSLPYPQEDSLDQLPRFFLVGRQCRHSIALSDWGIRGAMEAYQGSQL
jgi:hypothetical protein